jgi:hypothetical protein
MKIAGTGSVSEDRIMAARVQILAFREDGDNQRSVGHPEDRVADLDQDGGGDELPEAVHEQVAGETCRLEQLRHDDGWPQADPVGQRIGRYGRGDPHHGGDR